MFLRFQDGYIHNPHLFHSVNSYPNTQNYHNKSPQPLIFKNNFITDSKNPSLFGQFLTKDENDNSVTNQGQKSYAKNQKNKPFQFGRTQQMKKQQLKLNYRKELQKQMKEDKQRKIKQKQKIERQDLQRQRKFYAEIQNKGKDPKKEGSSYLMMRSSRSNRKKDKRHQQNKKLEMSEEKPKNEVNQLHTNAPKIIKRGGYHNQSALDTNPYKNQQNKSQILNFQQQPQNRSKILGSPLKSRQQMMKQQRQLQIIKERNYEEQRINNIIKLQQKMLRKLDRFREQIIQTNKHLNLDKQVHHIRNYLKSKPIKLEIWSPNNDPIFQNNQDFFSSPKIEAITQSRSRNRSIVSRIQEDANLNQQYDVDNRSLTQQNPQSQYQGNKESYGVKRNRRNIQIKLFKRDNDKNYQEVG